MYPVVKFCGETWEISPQLYHSFCFIRCTGRLGLAASYFHLKHLTLYPSILYSSHAHVPLPLTTVRVGSAGWFRLGWYHPPSGPESFLHCTQPCDCGRGAHLSQVTFWLTDVSNRSHTLSTCHRENSSKPSRETFRKRREEEVGKRRQGGGLSSLTLKMPFDFSFVAASRSWNEAKLATNAAVVNDPVMAAKDWVIWLTAEVVYCMFIRLTTGYLLLLLLLSTLDIVQIFDDQLGQLCNYITVV